MYIYTGSLEARLDLGEPAVVTSHGDQAFLLLIMGASGEEHIAIPVQIVSLSIFKAQNSRTNFSTNHYPPLSQLSAAHCHTKAVSTWSLKIGDHWKQALGNDDHDTTYVLVYTLSVLGLLSIAHPAGHCNG